MVRSHPNVKAFNVAISFKIRIRIQNKKGKEKCFFIAILGEEEFKDKALNFIAFIEVNVKYIKNFNLNILLRIA